MGGNSASTHGKCPVADLTKSANWGGGNFSKCPVADLTKICKHMGQIWKICKFLQAHISKCPVADLRNWGGICKHMGGANWGGISANTHQQMSSGRFDKICKLGGEINKCPVADLTKSANWGGGISANTHQQMSSGRFDKICKLGGDFCKHTCKCQWQI